MTILLTGPLPRPYNIGEPHPDHIIPAGEKGGQHQWDC